VGVAAAPLIVYVALETLESAQLVRTAMALIVCEVETLIGLEYCVEDVVGVDPFVV
jgi:hypothetical protein